MVFSYFPTMSISVHDVYGSLLKNGMILTQLEMMMDIDLARLTTGYYYQFVRAVYLLSPRQALYWLCSRGSNYSTILAGTIQWSCSVHICNC